MKPPVILCVEDSRDLLNLLMDQAQRHLGNKVTVEGAASGAEALALVKELDRDGYDLAVVITDLEMPYMRGDDFLVKLHETHPECYKFILSGMPNIEALRNVVNNARLYRCLEKPWDEDELMKHVERALARYMQYVQLLEHSRMFRSLGKSLLEFSSEMEPKRLINKFLQVVIDNTEAERAYFLASRGGRLAVDGIAAADKDTLRDLRQRFQADPTAFSLQITEAVTDTLQADVNDPTRLVAPLSKKGKNMGYVFLENPTSRTPFSYEHQDLMQILTAQAAISIDNATLYSNLEDINREILQEKEKVEAANRALDIKNKEITDSIHYAKRIQRAVMHEPELLQQFFTDSFILYQPKDIVSGDFYWFSERLHRFLIAAADCTGHGVPGAFMSLIGSMFLNQIANEFAILEPDVLLDHLNHRLKMAFNHQPGEEHEGMDMAFCSIDTSDRVLQFAGARRSLLRVTSGDLIEIRGSHFSIGTGSVDDGRPFFECHDVHYEPGDMIYLFTDGFIDQFGGEPSSKYSLKRFKELVMGLHSRPAAEQKLLMESALVDWMGKEPQTDDILVIGIRLP